VLTPKVPEVAHSLATPATDGSSAVTKRSDWPSPRRGGVARLESPNAKAAAEALEVSASSYSWYRCSSPATDPRSTRPQRSEYTAEGDVGATLLSKGKGSSWEGNVFCLLR